MDFKNILEKDDKKIYIGYKDDKLLSIDIRETPSLIITGSTGTGKSVLLNQILGELINKYTSLEMGIISIDTSGVELQEYTNSNYALFSALDDLDKSIVALSRVLKEIDRRKNLLNELGVITVSDYNEISDTKLPLLVVAIDDDKQLLAEPDIDKMLSGIISQLKGLNIFFILATSDVFNKFFMKDKNTFASMLISFDYTSDLESEYNNIEGSDDLHIGEFLVKQNDKIEKYHNFEEG